MRRKESKELILTNYPIFYLSKDEIANPHTALQDFFSFEHLTQIRELLWQFYQMLVTGNYLQTDALTPRERFDLALLYEYLLKLVEAAHLLNEKNLLK